MQRRDSSVSPTSWLASVTAECELVPRRARYMLFHVEKILAAQHCGRRAACILGSSSRLIAVLAYATYITMQFSGIRKLQSEMVDRNRKDSLQLLRIQNDLNSIGLAMRDMLDAGEPYPLTRGARSSTASATIWTWRCRQEEALGRGRAHQRPAPLPQPVA